jgi:hypothetical protein
MLSCHAVMADNAATKQWFLHSALVTYECYGAEQVYSIIARCCPLPPLKQTCAGHSCASGTVKAASTIAPEGQTREAACCNVSGVFKMASCQQSVLVDTSGGLIWQSCA